MVWYGDRGKIVASGRGFRVGKGFHRCTSSEGNNVLSRRRPSSSSGESFVEYSFDNIWGAAEAVVSLRYRSNVQENEDPPVPLALGLNGTPVASKQTGNGIGGKIQALCWEVSIKHRRTLCSPASSLTWHRSFSFLFPMQMLGLFRSSRTPIPFD